MTTIPIGVTARNEAKNILALLDSLRMSIALAEQRLPVRFELHVILNDNGDETPQLLAAQPDIRVWHTNGGLVEAQRVFMAERGCRALFTVFSDADIRVEPHTLEAVARTMLESPEVEIAYAEKHPIRPLRKTPLAEALYLYNLREGYQTKRHYLNGQFFAIRHWHIPAASALRWDAARNNRFLHLEAGIRCDDIYLSRDVLARYGPEAIRCVPERILYRPPETLRGMYRKYQRMVMEIERLHCYFPDTRPAHEKWGRRRLNGTRLRQAPWRERCYYALFQAALLLCKAAYSLQRLYYTHWSASPCPTWHPVPETKERLH